jgi:hypothetical protein
VLDAVTEAQTTEENQYVAWKKPSAEHLKAVMHILDFPGHVFISLRSKPKVVMQTKEVMRGGNKKTINVPVQVGMGPVQRGGDRAFTYEMTLVGEIDLAHNLRIVKGHEAFEGMVFPMPGENLAKSLKAFEGELGRNPKEICNEIRLLALDAQRRGLIGDMALFETDLKQAEINPRVGPLLGILWKLRERMTGQRT